MKIVLSKELIMDNSHSLSIKHLAIATGEKFTVYYLDLFSSVITHKFNNKLKH